MNRRSFLLSGLMMTGVSLLLRVIDIAFTVYLSGRVGAEGMGLYHLILSVYVLFVTLSTSGIGLAATRLASEELAQERPGAARQALRKCVTLALGLSMLSAVLLFSLSGVIGRLWLSDPRTVFPLRILAAGLPCVGLSSCLKGYFLARRRIAVNTCAQILEELSAAAITVILLQLFMPGADIALACAALVVGSVAADVLSCVLLVLLFSLCGRITGKAAPASGLWKRIFAICLPVSASSYLRTGLITLENTSIPSGLRRYGESSGQSLAVFGMLRGMVIPVIFFPCAFLNSFTSLLIPEIAEANAVKDRPRIRRIAAKAFHLTLLFSVICAAVCFRFSQELGQAVYGSADCGMLIRTLAPLVPLMYLDDVVDGLLKGLGKQMNSLRFNTVDSLFRVGLIFWLIPALGIRGYLIVLYFSNVFNSLLSIRCLLSSAQVKIDLKRWAALPALCAAASVESVCLLRTLFRRAVGTLPAPLGLIACVAGVLALYLLLLRLTRCVTSDHLRWLRAVLRGGRASALSPA